MEKRYKKYRKWLNQSAVFTAGLPENELPVCREHTDRAGGVWVDDAEGVIAGISTYVLAPALNSFLLQMFHDAEQRGIKRLYFLARDGYLMYRCGKVLCEKLQLPIECRYLYCSRYSLRIPAYHLNRRNAFEYICRGGIDVTRRKIIERSGLNEEQQREMTELLGYSNIADEVIPYAELGKIREELESCEAFWNAVKTNSEKKLPLVQQYLAQEGLLEDVPYALADSGWVGSMQKTLNELLQETGCKRELEGYYWGLYELPEGVNDKLYHSYYFSSKHGLREKAHFSNCLYEAIYSAPHGMTIDYEKQGSKIEPVLERFSEERRAFLEKTEKYLIEYTERLAEKLSKQGQILSKIDYKADLKIVKKLMAEFMGHPIKEEAAVYGRLRFSDDIMDDAKKTVAEPLNEKELRDNHVINKALNMLGLRHGYIKESAWYEGSAALCGEHAETHRRQYALYKYLLYIRQTYWKKRK